MSVFQEFFIKYTTNAKEAKKDVSDFGQATVNTQNQINKTDETAKNLGLSFSKLALAGVAALEGFVALGKLKDGIKSVVETNIELEKTSKLAGIASRDLSVLGNVFSRAGGGQGGKEYLNFISQLNQKYAALGLNTRIKDVNAEFFALADKFKQMEDNAPGSSQALAAKLGIGPDLWLGMKEGSQVLQDNINRMSKLDTTTAKVTDQSYKLGQEWSDIGVIFNSAFNQGIPAAKILLGILVGIGEALRVILDGLVAIGDIGSGIVSFLGFNFHAAGKSFGKAGDAIGDAGKAGNQAVDYLTKTGQFAPSGNIPPQQPSASSGNRAESEAFWRSQGYTPAQVSALLANEQSEGGFANNAVGDNGQAQGLFQWHLPRRAAIYRATGIDVSTASHADQLRAAAWELQQTGYANRLRGSNSPKSGAAILTEYEAPANAGYQALKRGQLADSYFDQLMTQGKSSLADANASPLNSTSNSSQKTVTIGAITINTQATDANGIAGDLHNSLQQHLAGTVGSFDDGVKF